VKGKKCEERGLMKHSLQRTEKINLAMTFRLSNIPFRNRKDVGGREEKILLVALHY